MQKRRTEMISDTVAVDMAHVKGQEHVKRALEVAAAGGHHVLLVGPRGTGKTLLAHAACSILPAPTAEEAAEIAAVYQAAGLPAPGGSAGPERPFRSPPPTIARAALLGGGEPLHPGEVSLAHRGVLLLDEVTAFAPRLLEELRGPLVDRQVTLARFSGSRTFPAGFLLVATARPCPCGEYDPAGPTAACACTPAQVERHRRRVPGSLLDRVDLHVEVPRLEYEKLANSRPGEPSAAIRARVAEARARQRERFQGLPIETNGEMGPAEVHRFCQVDEAGHALLRAAMRQLNLSARGYHRILKVARTIADLAGSERLHVAHLAEAIQYRPRREP
jgi:magnesium chelatase family protein